MLFFMFEYGTMIEHKARVKQEKNATNATLKRNEVVRDATMLAQGETQENGYFLILIHARKRSC